MRALTSTLTTAQQGATLTPYVRLYFQSRNRATTRTYTTADATNRILMVRQMETRTGGRVGVEGVPFPVSATIRLLDHDNSLNLLSWVGYRVDVGWGLATALPGNEYSEGEPLIVVRTKSISERGVLHLELYCVSLWDMLLWYWTNQVSGNDFVWGASMGGVDTSARHIFMELLGGAALEALGSAFVGMGAAIQADYAAGGTNFTTYTAASASIAANDVPLLPTVPIVNDAFYFGMVVPFDRISINLTTVGIGDWSTVLEYWNGTTWVGTGGGTYSGNQIKTFRKGELQIVDFDRPTAWAAVNLSTTDPDGTLGDYAATFPNSSLYYVRIRVSAFVAVTTQPIATRIFVAQDYGIALDTSNALQGDDELPQYASESVSSIEQVIEDVLAMTRMGVILKKDGFHLVYIDPAGTVDYTYGLLHKFWSEGFAKMEVLPNTIVYDGPAGGFSSSSVDAASVTAHGTVSAVYRVPSVTTAAIALRLANSHIARLQRDKSQGELEAPMHCGQEVWDLITINDSRNAVTYNARVSQIVREFEPGVYKITVTCGGIESMFGLTRSRLLGVAPEQEAASGYIPTAIDLATPAFMDAWKWLLQGGPQQQVGHPIPNYRPEQATPVPTSKGYYPGLLTNPFMRVLRPSIPSNPKEPTNHITYTSTRRPPIEQAKPIAPSFDVETNQYMQQPGESTADYNARIEEQKRLDVGR